MIMPAMRSAPLLPYQAAGSFSGMLRAEELEGGTRGILMPWSRISVWRKFWSASRCRSERCKYFLQTACCATGSVAMRWRVTGSAGVLVPITAAESCGVTARTSANTVPGRQRRRKKQKPVEWFIKNFMGKDFCAGFLWGDRHGVNFDLISVVNHRRSHHAGIG